MKLPVYIPQESVGVAQQPMADPRMFAMGGSGLELIGRAIGTVAEVSMRVAEAEEKAQDALAKSQAGEAHSALLLGLKTAETDLELEQDPNKVFPAYKQAVDTTQNTIRARLSPQALKHYDAGASRILAESAARVYAVRNSRFKDGINAATAGALATEATQVGQASLYDSGAEFFAAQQRAFGEIDKNAVMDAAKKQAEKEKWQATNFDAYATRFAAERPQMFLALTEQEPMGLFRDMPAKRRVELQQSARSTILSQMKDADAKAERELDRQREMNQTRLTDLSQQGLLTTSVVEQARDKGWLKTRQDYDHFIALANKGPVERPSEPSSLFRFTQGVFSEEPTYTQADVRAAMTKHIATRGAEGLSNADGQRLLSELTSKANTARSHRLQEQSIEQQAADRQDRELREAYNQAKDQAFLALGIKPGMMLLDTPPLALASAFLNQFNAIAATPSNRKGMPARDAMFKILPPLLEAQSKDAQLKYDERARLTGHMVGARVPDIPTGAVILPPEWQGWYQQQAAAVEALKATNPVLYQQRRQDLMELRRGAEEVVRATREQLQFKSQGTGKYAPVRTMGEQ